MATDLRGAQAHGLPVLLPVSVVPAETVDRLVAEVQREFGDLLAHLDTAVEEARVAESAVAATGPEDDVAEDLILAGIRGLVAERRSELARALQMARREADRRVAEAEMEAMAIRQADVGWIQSLLESTAPAGVAKPAPAPMPDPPDRSGTEPGIDPPWAPQLIEPPTYDLAWLRTVALDALLPLGGVVLIIVLLLLLLA